MTEKAKSYKEENQRVTDYTFQSLSDSSRQLPEEESENDKIAHSGWKFKKIFSDFAISKEQLNKESSDADENGFQIEETVRSLRGIKEVNQDNKKKEIENKVLKRVQEIEKDAFEKGYSEGIKIATQEINEKLEEQVNVKLKKLEELIESIKSNYSQIMKKNMEMIQILI